MTSRRGRVLLVEDEAIIAMLLEDMLTDLGYEVVAVAGHMAEAAKLANELAIDLAVIDVNLNGVRTYPVAEILESRSIPFVFATGYGEAGLTERLKKVPILQKPFQDEDLGAAIARATAAGRGAALSVDAKR